MDVEQQAITPVVIDSCFATLRKPKDEANTEGTESRKSQGNGTRTPAELYLKPSLSQHFC